MNKTNRMIWKHFYGNHAGKTPFRGEKGTTFDVWDLITGMEGEENPHHY